MFGNGSKDLEVQLARLEVKVEFLEQQVSDKDAQITMLRTMLERSQEALTAKESPEAYRDHQFSKEGSKLSPEDNAERNRLQQLAKANGHLLSLMEGPLFKDPDDMISMLSRVTGPPTFEPIHDNGES